MNLFDVLVGAARRLEALHEANATGGSTTTLVDSKLTALGWADDHWNGGSAFLIYDAAGAAAAPQGESRAVSDYVSSTGTITVSTAFTAAPAVGDFYGGATNRYPRGTLISKVNEALSEIGDIPTVDITSLTTLAATREYSLPVAAKRDLRQVWIARNTAAPYDWEKALAAYVEWAGANTAGNLIFPYQPPAGYKIKLVYLAAHGFVQADTDKISEYVALDWLATAAALRAARMRLAGAGSDERSLTALVNDLIAREAKLAARRLSRSGWPASFPRLPYQSDGLLPVVT